MKLNKYLPLLIFCSGFGISGFSQEIGTEKDSLVIYNKIEEFSQRSKLTRLLYDLVFIPTERKNTSRIRFREQRSYRPYQGKIIRNIIIENLDPFGYSVYDTVSKPRNWSESTGNKIHIKSSKSTIRDLLLIEENARLDTLLLKESERLLRSQIYIRSALITAAFPNAQVKGDSIDVTVRVQDSWSLLPEASFSTNRNMIGIKERNFIGTGHELGFKFIRQFNEGENAYVARYIIPNFKNTFIRSSVHYIRDLDDSYYKGVNLERIFYSPFTTWAGGVYVDQQYRKDSVPNISFPVSYIGHKYNTYDFWAGLSFPLFEGVSEDARTTNLITSARLLRVDYRERPPEEIDNTGFFSSETFYMGSIGIASRQFVKDQYIFNYGFVEDVPVGTVYGLTTGYQRKNEGSRLYLGGKIAFGNYLKWGFLSTNFEMGSFFRDKKTEQTTFSFQVNYFTNLINISPAWKMRQFIKPQFIWGLNRLNTIADRVTLNEYGNHLGVYGFDYGEQNLMGIQGYRSNLYGTQKMLVTLQTQFYAPWNIIGFRLNPYINLTAAMIGDDVVKITASKLYSSIGAGVIISNDYLVFSTFQLSFAWYPAIPGRGDNILRTNAFDTYDFGFQDFEFGRPRTVLFK